MHSARTRDPAIFRYGLDGYSKPTNIHNVSSFVTSNSALATGTPTDEWLAVEGYKVEASSMGTI
ncbi:hypothetical protein [Dyadobacter sp. OTU695]|uniref:hypothetical protein n=1 Tax=Dyadobacter sp. OTU695 TaxID=3043860 RepID=UPI00313E21FD